MGVKNYLIEGVSGAGKTTVAKKLKLRGYHVIDGDKEIAYQGDPITEKPLKEPMCKNERDKAKWKHNHWIWNTKKVESLVANHNDPISFFCGGSRNFYSFIDLFDAVFVLEVDSIDTLFQRIDERVKRRPTHWGGKAEEKELIANSHRTKADIPKTGFKIDANAPIDQVLDNILKKCN